MTENSHHSPEITAERKKLYDQANLLFAGHTVDASWWACCTLFANIIGFSANDEAHANHLVELSANDLKKAIHDNWDEIRAARARSDLAIGQA